MPASASERKESLPHLIPFRTAPVLFLCRPKITEQIQRMDRLIGSLQKCPDEARSCKGLGVQKNRDGDESRLSHVFANQIPAAATC